MWFGCIQLLLYPLFCLHEHCRVTVLEHTRMACQFHLCLQSENAHTRTHARPFNAPLSRTTQVSRYQKGKTNLDYTEARYSEWQWHELGHMQICTSLQTDNHTTTQFFTGRMPFLPPNQQRQSTEGTVIT